MTILAPAAAGFALILPAIAALYFLRIRRPEHRLSSTLLWRRAVRDMQASVPWQRLRPTWLLVLQLMAAALLVLALLRPVLTARAQLAGHTIVVIDVAAPMQATDTPPSRFEVARSQVRELIDQVGPANRMTLIAMGDQPRVITSATGDRSALAQGLAGLAATTGSADLGGALELARAAGGAARDTRLILLSDGVTAHLAQPLRLPFPLDLRIIGRDGENLAITALTTAPAAGRPTASVHVANLGRQRRRSTLELRGDGRLIDARPVEVEPGSGADIAFALPPGAEVVTASLSPPDRLALDDSAVAVVRAPRLLEVTLVSQRNLFLQRALSLRRDVRVTVVPPSGYRPGVGGDLIVFDGFVPPQPPLQPHWIVNPSAGTAGAGEPVAPGRLRPASAYDPLLADVSLADVHVARSRDLRASNFGRALIESPMGPLVLVHDEAPRAVLIGFDLHESDLPLRAAFPILVDHLSAFTLPPLAPPRSHLPGEPVEIAVGPGPTMITVVRPDGSASRLPVTGGTAVDRDTAQTGLYQVEAGGRSLRFAVNLFDPARSTIAPVRELRVSGSEGAGGATRAPGVGAEVWPWVALLAMAVLLAEWWRFHHAP